MKAEDAQREVRTRSFYLEKRSRFDLIALFHNLVAMESAGSGVQSRVGNNKLGKI